CADMGRPIVRKLSAHTEYNNPGRAGYLDRPRINSVHQSMSSWSVAGKVLDRSIQADRHGRIRPCDLAEAPIGLPGCGVYSCRSSSSVAAEQRLPSLAWPHHRRASRSVVFYLLTIAGFLPAFCGVLSPAKSPIGYALMIVPLLSRGCAPKDSHSSNPPSRTHHA